MATNRHANQTDVNVHTPYRQVFADSVARLADATVYTINDINKLAIQTDTNEQYRLSSFSPTTWTSLGGGLITEVTFERAVVPSTSATEGSIFVSDGSTSLTTGDLYYREASNGNFINLSSGYSPNSAGTMGYSSTPNLQDASSDSTNVVPVIYGPSPGFDGGAYWVRTANGTHPIRGKLRRGILDVTTGFAGTGWWTTGDGNIFLTYISGVGYQIAFSSASGSLATLKGSAVNIEEWPWEEANANANIVTFRISIDGYRWKTLFTVDVSVAPYSTSTSNFAGFFIQGTDTELLIERSDVQ
jgi:hypothetical protein